MNRKKKGLVISSIILGVAVILTAGYIMVHGLGLQESLDFGAGAYYYADIPEFEKYLDKEPLPTTVPFWAYVVLFLAWGALMYFIWDRIDRHGNN